MGGPTPSVDDAEAPPATVEHIELVRVIDRTTHLSLRHRQRELEFHVWNPLDNPFKILYLPLPGFCQNLRIFDEDGTQLTMLANRVVEASLEEMSEQDPEAYARFQHRFKQARYKLCVVFPKHHPFAANSFRIVTLKYEDSDPVRVPGIAEPSFFSGWRYGGWKRKLFNVPQFSAKVERFPGHPHDHQFVVLGLPEYELEGPAPRVDGSRPVQSEIHDGKFGGRVFSARLPGAEKGPYTWNSSYEIYPLRRATMNILGLFLLGGLLFGLLGIAVAVFSKALGADAMTRVARAGAGAVAASSIGLMFSLDNEWTERYKFLLLGPLFVNALAWSLLSPLLEAM